MDRNRFTRFEERVRSLVEGSFARLFSGRVQPREVAVALARAMEESAVLHESGRTLAPNRYAVHLHPDECTLLLEAQPDLAAMLADHLMSLASDSGLWLDTPPDVSLVPDGKIQAHTVAVFADMRHDERQSTQVMRPVKATGSTSERSKQLPPAFLIVDGNRYVALDRSVINIGRRRDNMIVLDDPRVSRQHCQLRFRFGAFVLYDLGSRGGTFVNEERVTECVLKPGDVISLAGVPLVYMVEDTTTGQFTRPVDTDVRLTSVDADAPDDMPEWEDFREEKPGDY